MSDRAQAELPNISIALQVERLDPTLFRSTTLHRPWRARGVFGGHVISQALVSATRSVDSDFGLHSLHCYFLLSASPALPILYYVERLREGKTYATRSVKAVQNGQVVFTLLCSFQKAETWQPSHQLSLPFKIPEPEECQTMAQRFRAAAAEPGMHERRKETLLSLAEEREQSNIEVRSIPQPNGKYPAGVEGCYDSYRTAVDGTKVYMWWMRARDLPPCDPAMQKCILGYISDINFLGVAPSIMGLKRHERSAEALGMISSLDHSIYYYDDHFDCGDWLLFVVTSARSGSGRAVVHGRMYTRQGTLIAVLTQEGVVRANVKRPDPPVAEKAKL